MNRDRLHIHIIHICARSNDGIHHPAFSNILECSDAEVVRPAFFCVGCLESKLLFASIPFFFVLAHDGRIAKTIVQKMKHGTHPSRAL